MDVCWTTAILVVSVVATSSHSWSRIHLIHQTARYDIIMMASSRNLNVAPMVFRVVGKVLNHAPSVRHINYAHIPSDRITSTAAAGSYPAPTINVTAILSASSSCFRPNGSSSSMCIGNRVSNWNIEFNIMANTINTLPLLTLSTKDDNTDNYIQYIYTRCQKWAPWPTSWSRRDRRCIL